MIDAELEAALYCGNLIVSIHGIQEQLIRGRYDHAAWRDSPSSCHAFFISSFFICRPYLSLSQWNFTGVDSRSSGTKDTVSRTRRWFCSFERHSEFQAARIVTMAQNCSVPSQFDHISQWDMWLWSAWTSLSADDCFMLMDRRQRRKGR